MPFQKGHQFYGDLSKPNYWKKGHTSWNKGKKFSKKYREKLSKAHLGIPASEHQKEIARKNWTGKNNPRWKPIGSKRKNHDYILVKIAEHEWGKEEWIIAGKKIGRKLYRDEVVHHINGIKYDNRPDNLEVMTGKEHRILHLKDNLLKC